MNAEFKWEMEEDALPRATPDAAYSFFAEFSHVEKLDERTDEPLLSGIHGPAVRREGTDEIRFLLNRMPPLIGDRFLLVGVSSFLDRDDAPRFAMARLPPARPSYEIGLLQEGVTTRLGYGWREKKAFAGCMRWPFGFENDGGMIAAFLLWPR